jgi:hypothetical protein
MRLSFVSIHIAVQIVALQFAAVNAFSSHRHPMASLVRPAPLLRETHFLATSFAASGTEGDAISSESKELSLAEQKKKERRELIRKEGGPLTFYTKFGALNPYAIYYGLTSILLGIPWFFAMTMCQFFYFITGNRIDRNRGIPIRITQLWGTTLLTLTRNWPKLENYDLLQKFYKEYVLLLIRSAVDRFGTGPSSTEYFALCLCCVLCLTHTMLLRTLTITGVLLPQKATSHVCSQS